MAIAAASRGTPLSTATDSTTYTMTDGGTPSNGILLLAIVNESGSPAPIASLSGYGQTWTLVGMDPASQLELWACITSGATSSAPQTTDTGSPTGMNLYIIEVTGAYVGGTVLDAFEQQSAGVYVVGSDNATATSISLTLKSPDNAANRPFAAFLQDGNQAKTPRTNWTELVDQGHGTPSKAVEVQYRSDAHETTASASWSTSQPNRGIAWTIREASASPHGTATPSSVAGVGAVPAPSASGSFSPSDISGLKIWLKADAGAGSSDNDPVATWTDQSGTSHSFTQATSGKRPLYKTNIQNGLPVVRFDGTDDQLDAGDLSATFPSAASVFAAVAQTGGTGKLSPYSTKNNDAWWRFTGGEGYWGVFRSTRLAATPGSGLSGTSWHVWSNTGDGSAYKMWMDRVQQINAGSYTFDGGNAHTLGWQQTNNEYPAMDLGELIVYDSVLSDADRQRVEDYLYAKWALLVAMPGSVAGTGAVPAPTAVASGDATATPSTVVGTGAVPAATTTGTGVASPASVSGLGGTSANGQGLAFTSPATVAGVGAVPAPTGFSSADAAPVATAGVGAVPAPTASGVALAVPGVVAGIGATPAPNPMGEGSGTANPLTAAGVGAVPAPTVFATAAATPAQVAGVGAVSAPTGTGTANTSPAQVAGTGVVPGPSAGAVQNGTGLPDNVIGIGTVRRVVAVGEGTGGGGGSDDGATDFWAVKALG